MNNVKNGFAHLILLLVLFALIFAVVGYLVLKKSNPELSTKLEKLYSQSTPTPTSLPTNAGMEDELNKIQLEDPSNDFTDIDKDISDL
jgi:hypothetical protein